MDNSSRYTADAFRLRVAIIADRLSHTRAGGLDNYVPRVCFSHGDGDAILLALARRASLRPHTRLARKLFEVFDASYLVELIARYEAENGPLTRWSLADLDRIAREMREEDARPAREFFAEHLGHWVSHAAWGDWHEAVPSGKVAVVATLGGRGSASYPFEQTPGPVPRRWFLVPFDEYEIGNTRFGFVVDPDRYEEIRPLG